MQTETPITTMPEATVPPPTETPVSAVEHAVVEGDQAAFKQARRAERAGKPLPVEKKAEPEKKADAAVEAKATPEQEADSHAPDADVSEAARTLRKNRASERAKKLRDENDELARELQRRRELRSELERSAPAQEPPPVEAKSTGTTATALDPKDPRPKSEDFTSWDEYEAARDEWLIREGQRRAHADTRARIARDEQHKRLQTTATALEEAHEAGREKYADFDAVTSDFVGALTHPGKRHDVAEYLAKFKDHAGEISYRIGKSPDLLKAVRSAQDRADLFDVLASVKRDITAPKPAPKLKSDAPPPPTVLGTKSTEPADELEDVVASGDQARYKALRLQQRAARLR